VKAGDRVRLIGVPENLLDDEELKTKTLFQQCLGNVFRVEALEHPEGAPTPFVRLHVGHVRGKEPYMETIWVEPQYLEIVD